MRTYEILEAVYNATAGNPNPLILLTGVVDGVSTGRFGVVVYYDQVMQANAVGGTAAVQAVLAPVLLGKINGAPYPEIPAYSANVAAAPFIPSPDGKVVPVPEVLAAGSWSA